jgi:hypothetical protein
LHRLHGVEGKANALQIHHDSLMPLGH